MFRGLILVCIALMAAATGTYAEEQPKEKSDSSDVVVTLRDAGRRPREPLRYDIPKELGTRFIVRQSDAQEYETDQGDYWETRYSIEYEFKASVVEAEGSDEIVVDGRLMSATVLKEPRKFDDDELDSLDPIDEHLLSLIDARFRSVFTTTGVPVRFDMEREDGQSIPNWYGFHDLERTLANLLAPLPDQAVGSWASWRSRSEFDYAALSYVERRRYSLDDNVSFRGSVEAQDLPVEVRSDPDSEPVVVVDYNCTVSGSTDLALNHGVPRAASETRRYEFAQTDWARKDVPVFLTVAGSTEIKVERIEPR